MKQELTPLIKARTDIFEEYWDLYLQLSIVKNDRWLLHHEVMEEILSYVQNQAWNHYDWAQDVQKARDKAAKRGGHLEAADGSGDISYVEYYDAYLEVIEQTKEAHIDLMVQFVESMNILFSYGLLLMEEESLVNQLKKLLIPASTTKCDHCARKSAIKCPVCKQFLCVKHYGAFWAVIKHGACSYCKRLNRMPSKLKAWMTAPAFMFEEEDGTPNAIFGGGLRIVSISAVGHRDLSESFAYVEKYFHLVYARISPPRLIDLKEKYNGRIADLLGLIREQFI